MLVKNDSDFSPSPENIGEVESVLNLLGINTSDVGEFNQLTPDSFAKLQTFSTLARKQLDACLTVSLSSNAKTPPCFEHTKARLQSFARARINALPSFVGV